MTTSFQIIQGFITFRVAIYYSMTRVLSNFSNKIGSLCLAMCISLSALAQSEIKDSLVVEEKPDIPLADSMFKIIDDMHERSAKMELMANSGLNIEPIKRDITGIASTLDVIAITLQHGGQYLDMKSLNTFGLLTDEFISQLDKWRRELLNYNQQISTAQTDINRMGEIPGISADSSNHFFVELYKTELTNLDSTFRKLKVANDDNQKLIQELQKVVSKNYYKARDIQQDISGYLVNYSLRTLGKEYPYIWEKQTIKGNEKEIADFGKVSLAMNQQIVTSYFIAYAQKHLLYAMAIFFVFFFWVRTNYKKVSRLENKQSILQTLEDPHTVSLWPILSGVMVVFSLWPLLDLNAPEALIILMQMMLFITTSIFIFKYGTRKEKLLWIGVVVTYIVYIAINSSYNVSAVGRYFILFVNVFLIFCSRFFLKLEGGDVRIKGVTRTLIYVVLIINTVAFLLNCAGRVTFARTLTNASLFAFAQIIALSIFNDIMVTAIQLKNVVSSLKEKQRSFIDMQAMSSRLFNLLSILTLFLCFALFAINMNFFAAVYKGFLGLLFNPRVIGGTTFTIGNILLFFLVIYLATIAQKYVGYVFGEGSGDSIPQGGKGSRLVIWKLIIIVVGLAIAFMLSGLPLDKVTIVLSALGVGIGLGLQSVVNNFVSGLILIFERPLQIGDYIEVGSLKGWVKDIGIRATRMMSDDGAEIIVPNGTILAGNLTNWTLSSSRVRVELTIKIAPVSALALAKEIIIEEILKSEHTINSMPPEILQMNLNNTSSELKVWFWVDHINRKESAKSEILNSVYGKFGENGILME